MVWIGPLEKIFPIYDLPDFFDYIIVLPVGVEGQDYIPDTRVFVLVVGTVNLDYLTMKKIRGHRIP